MNQNETKLDLVNPTNPNQIIKSEIITVNQNNSQTLENNINQDVTSQPKEQKPKKKFNLLLIIVVLIVVIAVGGVTLFFMQKG